MQIMPTMTETKPAEIVESRPFESSVELNKIFEALAKVQGAMGFAKKDSENPFYRTTYADLASCWETCRELLSKKNLCVIQLTQESKDGMVIVRSILGHSSGQWISGMLALKPTKTDPQGVGAAFTYGRRFGLMGLVGIAPDDDDDGNSISKTPTQNYKPIQTQQKAQQKTKSSLPIPKPKQTEKLVTEEQLQNLYALSRLCKWESDSVKNYMKKAYNVDNSTQLTESQYHELCDAIQSYKGSSAEDEVHKQ